MKNLHKIVKVFGLVMLGTALLFFTGCAGKYTGGGHLTTEISKSGVGWACPGGDCVEGGIRVWEARWRGNDTVNQNLCIADDVGLGCDSGWAGFDFSNEGDFDWSLSYDESTGLATMTIETSSNGDQVIESYNVGGFGGFNQMYIQAKTDISPAPNSVVLSNMTLDYGDGPVPLPDVSAPTGAATSTEDRIAWVGVLNLPVVLWEVDWTLTGTMTLGLGEPGQENANLDVILAYNGRFFPTSLGKATFGFTMEAFDSVDDGNLLPDKFRGQFQYNDHGGDVQFKCRICAGFIGPFLRSGWFYGELEKDVEINGDTGEYCKVWVLDLSEPGADQGQSPDLLKVTVLDDECDTIYQKMGPLDGGNIQFHLSQGNRGQSLEDSDFCDCLCED